MTKELLTHPAAEAANPAPDLSIIVVTWNSAGEILDCLESIYENTSDLALEVFVVDNASQDETVALVRQGYPQILVLVNDRNLGFAAANNLAIELASGRNILLLNPDTIVQARALETMVEYLDDQPGVGAAGPRLVRADGQPQRSCMHFPSVWVTWRGYVLGGGYVPGEMETPTPVQVLAGAALMVKREAIDEVGLLDTDFFMYGEETDWCFRIHQAGWGIYYLPRAEIVHLGGQSAKHVPVETYVRRRISRLIFVYKHRRPWEYRLLAVFTRLLIQLRRLRARNDARRYYDDVLAAYDERVGAIG